MGCQVGCICAKCFLDAEAYLKASDYIAQHREDDDHFLQEKMGKLACAPTGMCHLSSAAKATTKLGCAANSANHQVYRVKREFPFLYTLTVPSLSPMVFWEFPFL